MTPPGPDPPGSGASEPDPSRSDPSQPEASEPELSLSDPLDPAGAAPARGAAPIARRPILTALLAGTLGGGAVGAALPWPGLPDLPRLSSSGRQTDRTVVVYGGNDINGARENALKVWAATPSTVKAQLRASYRNVGASSTAQLGVVRNLLTRSGTDLVVIDPQYLPELVAKKQLRRFDQVSTDSLADLGCYPGLVSQCTVQGPLYAVPVNADAPMLVINLALLGRAGRDRAANLAKVADPRQFWIEANEIAAGSSAPTRTILLQTGDYEGITVCLVELIRAFGGDVGSDPALRTAPSRNALYDLRQAVPEATFHTQFSVVVRNYLLYRTEDLAIDVSQPLARFGSAHALIHWRGPVHPLP